MQLISRQRGDTIIEVMVAFSVFAMIAVGALTVMNQGTAGAQNTLETTLVRQEVDTQAEMLRFLHQAYLTSPTGAAGSPSAKFRDIIAFASAAKAGGFVEPSAFAAPCTQAIPVQPENRFMLGTEGEMVANVLPIKDLSPSNPPRAQLASNTNSYGLWIEPVVSNVASTRYIDFHVRACWESASDSPQRTIGTIIRLYAPEDIAIGGGVGPSIPIPTPPPAQIINETNLISCNIHSQAQRLDSEGEPTWDPTQTSNYLARPYPEEYGCAVPSPNDVYSCSNYDATFDVPDTFTLSSDVDLRISYDDATCNTFTVSSTYNYKVVVYVNNVARKSADLRGPSGRQTIENIGPITTADTITIRWWNNDHTYGDPDFVIREMELSN